MDQLGDDARIVSLGTGAPPALLSLLLQRSFPEAAEGRMERLALDLAEGRRGERIEAGKAVIWAVQADIVDTVRVILGVADECFETDGADDADEDECERRILVLVLTPRRISALRHQALPTLTRFFKADENARRMVSAATVDDMRTFGALMELDLREHLLVEDAMRSVQYRVYPETPFGEVADLMVRRGIHSVPVVGQEYEFLGIITTGDALKHLLPRIRKGEESSVPGLERSEVLARDVMTRSVMCVSEDQSLVDAANAMVHRKVELLPVVREGALIGSIDRNSVLELLFGQTNPGHESTGHS
jgi:CBS domain-containing protein